MLLSLLTSPTTVLKKFKSDRNNLPTASSNLPSIRDSNNESNLWCKKYADKNLHLDEYTPSLPLPGTPQDPEDPVDEILRLYNVQ